MHLRVITQEIDKTDINERSETEKIKEIKKRAIKRETKKIDELEKLEGSLNSLAIKNKFWGKQTSIKEEL